MTTQEIADVTLRKLYRVLYESPGRVFAWDGQAVMDLLLEALSLSEREGAARAIREQRRHGSREPEK